MLHDFVETVSVQSDNRIQVPNYRALPRRDLPSQPTAIAQAAMPDSNEEAAYIRLRGQTQDELDIKIDYDLDSDDEQWLTNRKAKASSISALSAHRCLELRTEDVFTPASVALTLHIQILWVFVL